MTDLLLASFADASIRVAMLAAAVAVVLAVFRIRSGSTRHAAWTAVAAAMLTMPLLTRVAPTVSVTFPAAIAMPPVVTSLDVPEWRGPEPATLAGGDARRSSVATPAGTTALAPTSANAESVRLSAIAVTVYFAGVTVLLVRFFLGAFYLFRIRGSSRSVAVSSETGAVMESALVATPVTIGAFAPRIILPLTWREWSPEMRTAVLAHEHAHAVRHDPLIALLARLNCVVFWFHPLAWWLERKLAVLAEHACDDAALRLVTQRSYAETLLDIATMVRRHNGRLVSHAVGVDGNGRLGHRIDRVLAGKTAPAPSHARQLMVALSCAIVIAAVVACRQERSVPPLREDPELAAQLKADASRAAAYDAARKMTAGQAAKLETVLERNPEDDATREQLLAHYTWTGRDKEKNWDETIAGRRRHALWIVEHRPESYLATGAYVSRQADPEGHAQLRDKWLEHVARENVSADVLNNAVGFLSGSDPQLAEKLLLRAQTLHPEGPLPRSTSYWNFRIPWMERLGYLYASAVGSSNPETRAWARERLESSTDGEVLNEAGYTLAVRASNADERSAGRRLIERAAAIDPTTAGRSRELLRQLDPKESKRFYVASMREALPKATGSERLVLLARLSEIGYMGAEGADWAAKQRPGHPAYPKDIESTRDRAADEFAQSKAYAGEALDLARSLTNDPEYPNAVFRAHIAIGLNALRDGDRQDAVRHLHEAANVPAPKEPMTEPASYLEYRLVNYLLKYGERESVIAFLERAARSRDARTREGMLKEATAIREGRMPERYQRLLASGSL